MNVLCVYDIPESKLARDELRQRCKQTIKSTLGAVIDLQAEIDSNAMLATEEEKEQLGQEAYRSWRRIINSAKRELVRAESCAIAFSISGDVQDGFQSLQELIRAQLDAALAFRDKIDQPLIVAAGAAS